MKFNIKVLVVIMVTIMCTLMSGCNSKDSTDSQKNVKDDGVSAVDNTSEEASKTEDGQSDSNKDSKDDTTMTDNESNADTKPEVKLQLTNKTIPWEMLKEIKATETKIKSRFVGFLNKDFGMSTYQYGTLYYTLDGGKTWTFAKNDSACIAGLEIVDEKNAIISANYSQVRVSSDGGANWEKRPNFGDMKNEHCRYLSFFDKNNGWIANRKEVGYTTDGALNFVNVNVPQNLSDVSAIWLSNSKEGYILSSDGIMYSTTDGGATWSEKNLNISGLKIMVCPTAALHVVDQKTFQIVAYLETETEKGYYYFSTKDGGDTWDQCDLISKDGPGYIYINREGTMLTITEDKDKTIRVYQFVQ